MTEQKKPRAVSMAMTESDFIDVIKHHLKPMSAEDRMDFVSECMKDYCEWCGSENTPCLCAEGPHFKNRECL